MPCHKETEKRGREGTDRPGPSERYTSCASENTSAGAGWKGENAPALPVREGMGRLSSAPLPPSARLLSASSDAAKEASAGEAGAAVVVVVVCAPSADGAGAELMIVGWVQS
jgi:hypothetical protein